MTGKTSPLSNPFLVIVVLLLTSLVAGEVLSDEVVPLNLGDPPAERLAEVASFFSVNSAQPGKTYPAAVQVKIKKDWHINSALPYQDWLIPAELIFDTVPGLTPHTIVYPAGFEAFLADQKMSVYHEEVVIGFEVTIDNNLEPGEYSLPVGFIYQPCNNKECRPPETGRSDLVITVGEEGEPVNAVVFARLAESGGPDETDEGSAATGSELQRLIGRYGFWGYFLALGLAFITGLLLSFSPCTYPMIPITVSIFAGQKRSVGRGFVMSLFYVGSMAVVYGIMGLIVSLVGGVFGAWLASTPVVIGITVIFVIFALSMFGLYELQVPNALRQKMGIVSSGGGIFGAVILGIVAALVVSPCVGPFVAGILLYIATHGSPVLGFLVLFVFALGLGTLYVILGTFSSAINALPGSGEWMESVKKFFGFVLLLMALYFLRTIISPALTALLAGLILVALGVFGGGLDRLTPEARFFPRLKKYVGILALLVGLYFLAGTLVMQGLILPPAANWLTLPDGTLSTSEKSLIDWDTDLEAGLERARLENKPVLIDTWATWCANCRVLDKKTFGNPEVAAEAARFVSLKIQLETAGSPQTKEFMARFGLKHYSLPTTLLMDSSGEVRRVLQGVVGPEDMLTEMKKIS
ncbi:MAG: thioredoxin family protein [candidate division Zixibacteria bacterium]|nr:thioredoxin family protein [candidate division Zixibacteria bacterium]